MSCLACSNGTAHTRVLVRSKLPDEPASAYQSVVDGEVCARHASAYQILDHLRSHRMMVGPGVGEMDVEVVFYHPGTTPREPRRAETADDRLARLERFVMLDHLRRNYTERIHECRAPDGSANVITAMDPGRWLVEVSGVKLRVFHCPACGVRLADPPAEPAPAIAPPPV